MSAKGHELPRQTATWRGSFIPDNRHEGEVSARPGWAKKRTLACCHSITSSARTKIEGGTVRPSTLAVLVFTAISNFTGT
jgi:hypothetical protein